MQPLNDMTGIYLRLPLVLHQLVSYYWRLLCPYIAPAAMEMPAFKY